MQRLRTMVSFGLLLALTFSAGYFVGQQPGKGQVAAQDDEVDELFQPFWEAYDIATQRYVDPLDPDMLMQGAISGMMDSIGDPNTNYLSAEEYARWNESLSGEFEGIGATVRQDEESGALLIVQPISGSPAEQAGLQAGDAIVTVGGEDITDLSQAEIISRVRGPAGTAVQLGIRREGEEDLIEVTVIRDRIVLPTLEFELLEDNIGYIRLYDFGDRATAELQAALLELDANNLDGLVLDLRGNPGGYLNTTLEVLSMFISEGPILIEQLPGGQEQVFEASGSPIAPDVPLAVLVDEASASASEITAITLHDRERAVIVGVTTFGKNTVQTINPLSNGGAVRISVARWVSPDGNSVGEVGFTPDVFIELDAESEEDNQLSAAIRALKGIQRQQLQTPVFSHL